MKGSGIPWIGEIPEGWSVEKLKGFLRKHEVKGYGDAMVLSLYRDHGVVPKDSRDDNHNRTGKDTNDYKYVRRGDLVINKMKAWQGSLAVSDFEGIVSPAYFIYEFIGNRLHRRFADYLLRSTYKYEFERVSGGIREGQWDLPRYDFEHMQVPVPELEEQQHIVDYLDERCGEIDEVKQTLSDEIEALQRLRKATIYKAVTKGLDESVPMKDSGVEWIGEVPHYWIMSRAKSVMMRTKIIAGSHHEEYQRLALTLNGVIRRSKEEADGLQPKDFDTYQILRNNELVFKLIDLENVRTSRVGLSAYTGIVSPAYIVCKTLSNTVPKYAFYYFYSMWLNQVFNYLGDDGVRSNLSVGDLLNVPFPIFDLSEQQRIANYLDERCAAIDSAIKTRTKQLERLEDYRKALVFAYVTGKKEVPVHE